jgi:hypothetical protein
MNFPEADESDAILLLACGPVKAGKTYLAQRWALELLRRGRHVVLATSPDPKFAGRHWNSIAEFRHPSARWASINVFPHVHPTELAAFAVQLGTRRRVVLFIDELDTATRPQAYNDPPPPTVPRFARYRPAYVRGPLARVVHERRHVRVDLVGTCRRFANVHRDVRELAHAVALFYTQDTSTLDQIRTPGVAEAVTELDPENHDYVLYYPSLNRPFEVRRGG